MRTIIWWLLLGLVSLIVIVLTLFLALPKEDELIEKAKRDCVSAGGEYVEGVGGIVCITLELK